MNGLPDRVGPLARIYSAYARLINILAGTSMAMVVVIMAVQVVARYVFNASLIICWPRAFHWLCWWCPPRPEFIRTSWAARFLNR